MRQISENEVEYERDVEYAAAEHFEALLDRGLGVEAAAQRTERDFPEMDEVQRRWLRG